MNGGYQAFMVFKGFNFALKIQIITNKYFLRNKIFTFISIFAAVKNKALS